jgi:hypothetical protein
MHSTRATSLAASRALNVVRFTSSVLVAAAVGVVHKSHGGVPPVAVRVDHHGEEEEALPRGPVMLATHSWSGALSYRRGLAP